MQTMLRPASQVLTASCLASYVDVKVAVSSPHKHPVTRFAAAPALHIDIMALSFFLYSMRPGGAAQI